MRVAQETGNKFSVKEVASLAASHLADVFERPLVWTHSEALGAIAPAGAGAV